MASNESFWSTLPGILTAFAGVLTALATLVGALYSAGVIGGRESAPPPEAAATSPSTLASSAEPATTPPSDRLRSLPAILSGDAIDAMLLTRGFYDKRRNPGGKGVAHQYDAQVIDGTPVVLDRATGLAWHRRGSDTMTLAAAEGYVQQLNKERVAGFADWRLPTLEEAMSLMEPTPQDLFHLDPVFPRGVNFIWTADRLADGRGLVIYFADGVSSAEPAEFNAWVRPVRSTPAAP
jgi:hypothetical protein